MRKLLLLLLTMLVVTVSNAATLLSKQYIGSVYYNFYDDGTAEVTYGTLQSPENYAGDIQIRSKVTLNGKDYTVTTIGEDAFYACTKMTSIHIPNTIKSIGLTAFYGCSGLTEIEIPSSVDTIATRAFYKCSGLKTVDLTNTTLKTFGTYAFAECYRLVNIYLPKTLEVVPEYAFYCNANGSSSSSSNNYSNKICNKIVIPNSVTKIGKYAFANYVKLSTIEFGNSVETIDEYAFYCYNTAYNSSSIKLVFPNSLKKIGDDAFENFKYLSAIEFGESIVSIGNYAFCANCWSEYNYSLKELKFPESLKTIGNYAFQYMKGLKTVEMQNSVTSVGQYAFSNCSALESVQWSRAAKTIPSYCFSSCTGLLSFSIPNTVTTIGTYAFSGCSKMGSISIPNSVTGIGSTSFSSCSQCIVYLCNDHISKTSSAFSPVKKVVSCDNVPMPVEINYAFFYTGKEQLYNIPETSSYTVTGNRRTEEGTQQVTVSLKDGFTWTNGTADDLVFDFTIYPAKFTPEQTLINAHIGQKLKDLTLPKGCKWKDDPNTVLEYTGENRFPVYYTPDGWTKAPLLIEMTVMVAKIAIELPIADTTEYIYNGKPHTYKFTETEFYKVTDTYSLTRTEAGTSYITITLKNKAKYMWTSGSTTDLSYSFVVKKQTVKKPAADTTQFVYTGKPLTYKLAEDDRYTIANNVQTNIGSYSVLVSLKDQNNYMWDNGSSSNQTYTFIINKNGVPKPQPDNRMFMYTGQPQTYNVPANDLYTVTGNVQTNVGTYTVKIALKDKNYYRWSDGTSSDITYTFKIEKLKVVIPPTYNGTFTYNGKPQSYPITPNDAFVTVRGYDSNTGRTGSDSIQVNAGTYYVILSLKDKNNSMWVKSLSDTYGSTGNLTYTFKIDPAEVSSYPAGLSPHELKLETYYGKTLGDITLPDGYKWVTPSYPVGAVGVKTFAATYTPKDASNYLLTRVNLTVTVKPQPVTEPIEDQTLFYYIAKPQKYTVELSDLYSVSNNIQTNVGVYNVLISLKDKLNYVWKTSGKSTDLTYKFVISKSDEAIFENGYNPNEIHPKVQYGQKLGEVMLPTRFSWKNPDSVATKIGDNKFVVIYTPSDPKNYNSIETEIVVDVTKRKVAYPEKDTRLFVYNGKAQTYQIAANSLYKVSNNVQTNAGRYDVKVALVDKVHYEWQDGTIDDIYQDFLIRTKTIKMPSIDSRSFVYDGKSHSLIIPTSADYVISGNKGVDAGRYEVSIALADKINYVWENNTTADIVATFSISKIKVDIPAADNSSFTYTGEPLTYKIEESDLYTVAGNVQTAAGRYDVKVSLNNPRNYEWIDGSTDNLIYNFYIKGLGNQSNLEIVNIPNISKRTFVYDGNIHYLAIADTSDKFTVVDDSGKYVGRYGATLSLTDKSKYVWENGSSDDVTIAYVITKAPIAIPAKDTKTYTYNGANQTYVIAKSPYYSVSNNVQKNAGRHEVNVSLNDPKNYEWEDGSSDDLTMIFKIGKKMVDAPAADATKFSYTGNPQTYTIAKSSLYSVSNNVQTNVGIYDVVVSLTDPKNYMWTDGSTDALSYNFVIRAEQTNDTIITIPDVKTRNFVYNGLTQRLDIPESNYYTISNNAGVNAGRYVATLSLTDPINTVWSDGTKNDVFYVFNIAKDTVEIPEIDHTRFVYTGKAQTYKVASNKNYTVTGNVQTKVGQYEVVVALNDVKNYVWNDGTVDDLSYKFVIRAEESQKKEIAIPAVVERKFIYNGMVQSLDIKNNANYTILNNKGVDVGRYTVTLALVDPETTVWENGSSDDVLLTFTIAKAQVDMPRPNDSVFTYNGKFQTYDVVNGFGFDTLYTVSNNYQMNAGRYGVNIALNDTKNYEWENGTFEDLTYSFLIKKAQVDEPMADSTKFIYNGKAQTYKIASNAQYATYGATQTLPGKYEVLVALKDSRNYEWSNGTTDDLIYNFVIRSAENEKKSIAIPSIATKNFIYDGTKKSLAIAANPAYKVAGNSGVEAGRYTVTLSLVDATNTAWSDGTTEDVKIVFTIAKAKVDVPETNDSTFTYNESYQKYEIAYDTLHCRLSNNEQLNAGKYIVKVSLNDTKNYEWTDGTIDDVVYNYVINKAQVEIPAADNRKFTYNGKKQTYKIADDSRYTVEGATQMMPGKYEVLVSLNDIKNYEWSNGTTEPLSYNFVIRTDETQKKLVEVPSVLAKKFVYDGEAKYLDVPASKDYYVWGDTAVNAGRYTTTLSLADPTNTVWSDGSTDDVNIVFTIAKAQVEKPAADNSKFTYNAKNQIYYVRDSSVYTISNNVQKNVGHYNVTVSLNDAKNYEWTDGSVDDLFFNFVINKAKVTIPAADNSKFTYTGAELTYKIAANANYTIEGNKQTMPGKYEVLVTLKDVKNYEWTNGTTDVLAYNFVIRAEETTVKSVAIPTVLTKNFVYDGTAKSLAIAANAAYKVTGNRGVDAGRYTVTLSLTDPVNTVWSDGSSDDIKTVFTIAKAQVEIPEANDSVFAYNGKAQTYSVENGYGFDTLYTVSNNIQKNAGKYVVKVALNDAKNFEWTDGSVDDLNYNFTINKAQVAIPAADNSKFTYTGAELTYKIPANANYTIEGNKQTMPGKYEVLVTLKDAKNYEWNNGTTEALSYNFVIRVEESTVKSITIPTVLTKNFVYDGTAKSLAIAANAAYKVAGNRGVEAGRYIVTLSLTDPVKTVWSDGSTDDVKVVFTIAKAQVEIPGANDSIFFYNGSIQTYNVENGNGIDSLYTVSNNIQKNAGKYGVKVSLIDDKNYEWNDGSVEDVVYNFVIAKAQVEIPNANDSVFTYNDKYQTYNVENGYGFDTLYTVSNNIQKNAGKYTVKIALDDAKNFEWSDGSVEDLGYNFTINKVQVNIPATDNRKFVYTGKELTYNIAANSRYTVEGNKQTMPGKYEVLVTLKDAKNSEWSNGTTEALSYNFVIRAEETELTPITIPTVLTKNFVYDGKVKSLDIATDKAYTITGNSGVDAGRYNVTLSLTDTDNTVWSDGSADDIKMSFTIAKAQVEIPEANDSVFAYNGKAQTYSVENGYGFDTLYTVSNNIQKNAGKYVVKVALNDAKNFEWTDGSVDDLVFNFTINKTQIEIPVADNSKFVYTGKELTYKIAANANYTVEGNKQTMPGKYEVLVTLNDAKNFEWNNGTTEALSYNFVIRAEETELTPIAIPSVLTKNFVYDGTVKSLNIAASKAYTISGNRGVNAGRYVVTLSLTDPDNTVWSDGSADDIKMSFTIAKAQVAIPEANDSVFAYNGKAQTYSVENGYGFDTLYTVSNNIQKNAGKYVVKVALNDAKNFEWTDGSVDDLSFNFNINKTQVAIPVEDNSKFVYTGKELTYKIAANANYTIEGNKQTMPGKYEVLVTLNDAKNFEWNNGTTEALIYNFVIRAEETELTPIAIPSVTTKNFVYDGTVKSLNIAASKAYTITGNRGVNAGRYTVRLSLTNPDSTVWSDGSTEDVLMAFQIARAQVEIPSTNDSTFVYNGKNQTYGVANNPNYTVSGNVKKFVGRYEVKVSLNDDKNYEWSDGSTDDIAMNFVINKAQIEIPAADASKFSYTGVAQTYQLPKDSLYIISGDVRKNAGRYDVNVALLDAKNYVWSDGSVDDLNYSFVIAKAQVEIPAADETKFIYNGKAQTYSLKEDERYAIDGATKTMPGKYEVLVSLLDTKNTEWNNGTTDNLIYNFTIRAEEIEKKSVTIPTVLTKNFIYDGAEKSLAIASSKDYTVTGNSGVNVGRYVVKLSLTDTKTSVWSDGSTEDIVMTFQIAKAQVEIPAADSSEFVYNADYQVYNVANSDLYSVTGNRQINIGNHDVVISLNDTKNYEWSDGTVGDIVYSFLIVKQEINITTVKIPVVENSKFTYNTKAQSLDVPVSEYYNVEGNTKTDAGKYFATVSLKDKSTMVWENGSTDDIEIPFVITKAIVAIPEADSTVFEYDGKDHTYSIPANALYRVNGDVQSLVGRHLVTVSLVDYTNYMWSDGTSNDLQYDFVIKLKEVKILPVAIPVISKSNFIYNGKAQSVDIKESPYYTVAGNSQILAGSYSATVTLKDKERTSWEDGTTADIVIPFSIAKAKVGIPAIDSTRFVYTGDTLTYSVAANSNYTVSGNSNVNAGNYQALVALNDKANTVWENGSSEDILLPYSIAKNPVAKPAADSTEFVYNGDSLTLNVPTSDWYSVSGNTEVKAGKYTANVALVDKANSVWADGSSDDVVIPFSIAKAQVEIPAVDTTKFFYTGDTLTYSVAENEYYTIKGNVQSMIGRYSVVISLNDIENYSWTDGSTLDLIYPFIVNEREVVMTLVALPVADTTMLVYNGEMQTFNIATDTNAVVAGNVRMNAGRYLATVSLADRMTMVWEDGTTDDIVIPFAIAKAQVEIPAADTSVFECNGKPQTYNIPASPLYTVDGNVQTNVGRYDVFVTLVDMNNYEWNDGTTGDLAYRFVINHPVELDTINPDDIKVPGGSIVAGDTVVLYDKSGDYIYDLVYDSLAHKQGFKDVKGKLGDEGIKVIVPENAKPGKYTGVLTITDINGKTIKKDVCITVCYPKNLIVRLMHDVLSVNNTENEFDAYQWYKDGVKIEGATKQFYCDPDGVKGTYMVQVVNVNGDTLFIAERTFEAVVVPFNVSLSKNPVSVGEQFYVTVEGITDSKILATSSLVVYNLKGNVIYNKIGIEKENRMALSNVGEYIIVVRSTGGQTISKHLLVK